MQNEMLGHCRYAGLDVLGQLTVVHRASIGKPFLRHLIIPAKLNGADLVLAMHWPPDADPTFLQSHYRSCLLYTSPSPRDKRQSRMPSSA